MAEFLKSQTPQELWKASLKPDDPAKPGNPFDPARNAQPRRATAAPGTGLLLDTSA